MITLGIVVGNRGFFPAHLCDTGRKEIFAVLEELGIGTVTLRATATKFRRAKGVLGNAPAGTFVCMNEILKN